MRSIVTSMFRKMLADLPEHVQKDARAGFQKWKDDKQSVGWKKINGMRADVRSVEIGRSWRALGIVSKEQNAVVWCFVGSHETYNGFLETRRQLSQGAWLGASEIKEKLKARAEKTHDIIDINCPRCPR